MLSGVGGHLTSSLLTKTSPVDIASIVPIGLQDPDSGFRLAAGIFNPALSIIQSVFDSVDPINYARHIRSTPLAATDGGQSVFVTYGVGDTFSPEKTQLAYLRGRSSAVRHADPERAERHQRLRRHRWSRCSRRR